MLECRVLGPLEVLSRSGRIDPGGPQPRRLVAALAMARGAAVSDDRLAEAVWGDRPPASPAVSLQAYVSRLRKALGDRDALPRTPAGYRLVARTDAAEFEAAVAAGHFEAALRCWRGRPYPELDEFAEAERARLTELHAVAAEERAAGLLAVGDAPAAVAELLDLVREEQYRERRWELLILALYRSARQAEALSALRRVRALLADDLGVDPGPALQSLERRLLAQDPGLLLPAPPVALPRPLSLFVGRKAEQEWLDTAFRTARLVTLVGPGGAGKTRLAVEWAADGFLARLADVRAPRDLPSAVATALGLADVPARITGVSGLLILDNCEHLIRAVAGLAVTLLAGNPRLRILATSREALGVDGERLVPVEPLPRTDAVALLTDRIAAVRPGWRPSPGDDADLARLAEALDGIPLALELAAARARVLGLHELTADGPVPHGAVSPHATLAATIAWSVDLLPPGDRALLLRLWPFEGGFTLEGAAAVGSDLSALSSLVARSVVAADTTVTPVRYRLLEIIRAYCRAHDPAPDASRAAHAAWVRALVARTWPELRGDRSTRAIRVLNRELPNLRAGLAHDLTAEPGEALRTAGRLEWFWFRGGHVAEGIRTLTAALAAPATPSDRARALGARASLHWIGGSLDAGRTDLLQALDLIAGDEKSELLGQLKYYEALMWNAYGEFARGAQGAREAIAISTALGAEWLGVLPRVALGAALAGLGDLDGGRRLLAEAIGVAHRAGQGWSAALGGLSLARAWLDESPPTAFGLLHEAIERFRAENDIGGVLSCLHTGALAMARAGLVGEAARLLTAVRAYAVRRGLLPDAIDPPTTALLDAVVPAWDGPVAATEEDMIALLPGKN
ncbi:BTAD domain-containing putative transcriptional regulator [Actinoplanes sp. RD1]|uniref:BTAD domain-containing putative transcriptional regulator n=1 Tax=Actinoplanes sp. RD1 TaxID=3064538 RepID=UPI002741F8D6|nr:BTAD domain-containing putative transcriptional regulator [Actinoplanes sp. RD1]